MSGTDRLVTITMSVDADGNIYDDTQTHGNTFAQVYRGFIAIQEEIARQVAERKFCPYNPKYGNQGADFDG